MNEITINKIKKEKARAFLEYHFQNAMADRNPTYLDQIVRIAQLSNCAMFSQYLIDKGADYSDKKEQKLLAQAYTDCILRALFELIETEVPEDDD